VKRKTSIPAKGIEVLAAIDKSQRLSEWKDLSENPEKKGEEGDALSHVREFSEKISP
jgi:hypothetical protein